MRTSSYTEMLGLLLIGTGNYYCKLPLRGAEIIGVMELSRYKDKFVRIIGAIIFW